MSFNPEYDHVYHAGIKKAIEDLRHRCVRIDDDASPMNVSTRIVRELIDADVIIADLSEPSPNVYYELGISHSIGNKTVTISQNPSQLPFDIRNDYTIPYRNDRDGIRLLYFELKRVIPQLLEYPHEPSNIVQTAGREFFDSHRQIQETLKALVQERQSVGFFKKYLDDQCDTDNSALANIIAQEILDCSNTTQHPVFIGVSGAAGVGKTRFSADLSKAILRTATNTTVSVLQLDTFMLDRAERVLRNLSGYDTKANDIDKAITAVLDLCGHKKVTYHPYNHITGEHQAEEYTIDSSDIIVLDGIHSFHPRLITFLAYKLFIYAVPQLYKELRFLADLTERSYTVQQAFEHADREYNAFEEFVLHYAKFADRVIEVDSYWKYRL